MLVFLCFLLHQNPKSLFLHCCRGKVWETGTRKFINNEKKMKECMTHDVRNTLLRDEDNVLCVLLYVSR